MTVLDLFSGIGGASIAAEWAGFQLVGHAEVDPYCCKILHQWWPGVTNYGDVDRTESFDGLRGTVDVIWASIPCQPHSLAGKRMGAKDHRDKWPATRAIIRRIEPRWVIIENPPGIISSGTGQNDEDCFAESSVGMLESICDDLAEEGFATQPFNVPVSALGAGHLRYRVFIVANADANRAERRPRQSEGDIINGQETGRHQGADGSGTRDQDGVISDAARELLYGSGRARNRGPEFANHSQTERDAEREGKSQSEGSVTEIGRRVSNAGETEPDRNGSGLERRDSVQLQERAVKRPSWTHGARDFMEYLRDSFPSTERTSDKQHCLRGFWYRESPLTDGYIKPDVCRGIPRISDGMDRDTGRIKNRAARLKALGNSVSPMQAYPFFEAIKQVEKNNIKE